MARRPLRLLAGPVQISPELGRKAEPVIFFPFLISLRVIPAGLILRHDLQPGSHCDRFPLLRSVIEGPDGSSCPSGRRTFQVLLLSQV
jgi:hypothetical protein